MSSFTLSTLSTETSVPRARACLIEVVEPNSIDGFAVSP
jgi:hypothetical protein